MQSQMIEAETDFRQPANYLGSIGRRAPSLNAPGVGVRDQNALGGDSAHAVGDGVTRLRGRTSRVCPLPTWRLQRAEAYIAAHLADTVTLADLADAAGLSRMHFAAQFRVATGRRPHEHLLWRRIEAAKALLAKGDTPLVEVALGVGFQAQSHFSTVFKKHTGASPGAWRRRARPL